MLREFERWPPERSVKNKYSYARNGDGVKDFVKMANDSREMIFRFQFQIGDVRVGLHECMEVLEFPEDFFLYIFNMVEKFNHGESITEANLKELRTFWKVRVGP